ncbi:MAG: NUDIX hydrolase [bacterium]
MPLSKWKKLNEQELYRNPWWAYRKDEFEMPNGHRSHYHYVHTNGSSMILPVTGEGKILMVRQYRYLCDRESLEFPCGGVKEGHDHEQTAREELAEETGHSAASWKFVGEYNPYNGVADEFCRVFIAKHLTRQIAAPDATEEFEIVTLTPDEIDAKIAAGEIWDGMSLAAWCLSRTLIITS